MTTTITDRERHERIAAEFERRPDATIDEVEAIVAAQLAADRAKTDTETRELDEVVLALTRCGACGQNTRSGHVDAFCPACRAVNYVQEADEAGQELVNGTTRRELVEAYRAQQAATP
jgi:hypothetical protein